MPLGRVRNRGIAGFESVEMKLHEALPMSIWPCGVAQAYMPPVRQGVIAFRTMIILTAMTAFRLSSAAIWL
jgi:hypothetical protein